MRNSVRLAAAAFIASGATPILVILYFIASTRGEAGTNGLVFVLVAAWVVGFLHILVFGIPALLILRRTNHLNWATIPSVGFTAGALPVALASFPRPLQGYSSGGSWYGSSVTFYENGEPTLYAWLSHGVTTLSWGVFGAIVAVAFWRAWLALGQHHGVNEVDA